MKASILRPGVLVSLKTAIRGGINYKRVDLERDHLDEAGARVARWETQRAITNPAEYEAAIEARGRARALVAGVCAASSFGLLCPTVKEGELSDAIAAARVIADEHNQAATCTRVDVFVLLGRIAQDDVEAARAISSEVRELLDGMKAGIAAADPAAIREAANKARALGSMLSADVAGQVSAAIVEARAIARDIVKRVEKSGELAADVVGQINVTKIDAARFAFLDLDAGAVTGEAPAGRGLDFEPAGPAVAMSAAPMSLEF